MLASAWTTYLGDGFAIAAGPLLVASQTKSPGLVALALLLQQLPYLLFGLIAGALSDRLDRRAIVITVDAVRAAVLALLAVTVVTGAVNVAVVLVAMFLLGTAEVFGTNAFATLLPMLVGRADLAIANSRVQGSYVTMQQLVGPSVGAGLFALGTSAPFIGQAVLVSAGAVFVSRIALPRQERKSTGSAVIPSS